MNIEHVRRLDPGVFGEEFEMTLTALSLRDTRQLLTTLLILTLIFSFSACAKRAHHENVSKANDQQSTAALAAANSNQTKPININTASAKELEQLPGIGKALAARIIEHRQKYGPFRRPEHLIIVRGISDRKFRALRDLITVE